MGPLIGFANQRCAEVMSLYPNYLRWILVNQSNCFSCFCTHALHKDKYNKNGTMATHVYPFLITDRLVGYLIKTQAAQLPHQFVYSMLVINNVAVTLLRHAASGEGCSALSVPGHRGSDKKPLAEVFSGSCLLLLPGLCGGCQPRGGHQGPTAAGHH